MTETIEEKGKRNVKEFPFYFFIDLLLDSDGFMYFFSFLSVDESTRNKCEKLFKDFFFFFCKKTENIAY